MNRLERRCAEDPEFLKRLSDAVRDIGSDRDDATPPINGASA